MKIMGTIRITGMSEDEIERMKSQAEEEGLSLSRWARYRLRAGDKLWDASGDFDVAEFDDLFNSKEVSTASQKPNNNGSGLSDTILANLSSTGATSVDELTEIVVDQLIAEALDDLQEKGKIQFSAREEGYKKL